MEQLHNLQSLIGELAKRHNVLLRPDDPAFVLLTLTELTLDGYVRRLEAALEAALRQISAGALQQREAARMLAEQTIANGAGHMARTMRAAFEEHHAAFEAVAAEELAALRQAVAEAQEERRQTSWALVSVIGGGAVAVLIGMLGAFWLVGG